MLNYQKVDNNPSNSNAVNDENFALFFNNHNRSTNDSNSDTNKNNNNNNNNNNSYGNYINGVSNHSYSTVIAPAVGTTITSDNTMDMDERIMEVPLLNNNNNASNEYSSEQHFDFNSPHCRCEQPGFAANLKNKSTQEAKCKILMAISLCGIFMIIEFLGGYMAGSLAIMTDAAHLASDCISFVIGLVAIWLGSRPPDQRMSFGYKRMEVMGAIVSILGIWILTATLIIVAVERIYSNDFDLDANTMMTISGIGILINIVMVFILHGSVVLPGGGAHGHSHAHAHAHSHSHSHSTPQVDILLQTDDASASGSASLANGNGLKHTKNCDASDEKNLNLRAAMIHVIGDLVQSVGVFLASVLIKFYPHAKFADPLCTLIFSVIVIMTTVKLFKESVGILLDAVPQSISLNELGLDLAHIDGVKSVHHLNVWSHTAHYSVLMVHLVIDFLADSNAVLEHAIQLAQSSKYNIKHCTIQIERLT